MKIIVIKYLIFFFLTAGFFIYFVHSCSIQNKQIKKYSGTQRSDNIEIVPIASGKFSGKAYKMTYIIDSPIDKVWFLMTHFPEKLLSTAPGILEYKILSDIENKITYMYEYDFMPGKYFMWKNTFYAAKNKVLFRLMNAGEVGLIHHFGESTLYEQGEKTKVVLTGYVDFLGVSNWVDDLSTKGLNAFLINHAHWQQAVIPSFSIVGQIVQKMDDDINFKPEGKYYALIIGNNKYQYVKPLQSSVWDAQAINKILSDDFGFEVTLLVDASEDDIISNLYQYRQLLKFEDHLLIYYAGHGFLDKEADEGYWWPVDARRDNPAKWISSSSITSSLKAIPARHILLVSDSCYSGVITRERGAGIVMNVNKPDYFEKMDKKKSRKVMTSGGLEPVLDSGGDNNHSIFASAFIQALNSIEKASDTTSLFPGILRKVKSDAEQTPEYNAVKKSGDNGGDFIFFRKP